MSEYTRFKGALKDFWRVGEIVVECNRFPRDRSGLEGVCKVCWGMKRIFWELTRFLGGWQGFWGADKDFGGVVRFVRWGKGLLGLDKVPQARTLVVCSRSSSLLCGVALFRLMSLIVHLRCFFVFLQLLHGFICFILTVLFLLT